MACTPPLSALSPEAVDDDAERVVE
eukprot:SAG11_NODE_9844_length_873_cov_1.772201_2_plen_24_part_01